MVLPASQEKGKLLKKRYAVFNDDGSLAELKGFEIKRRGELQIVKLFQGEVFEKFLNGETIEECYEAVGEVGNHWLNILLTEGKDLEDEELIDLISENKNMSKTMEEKKKKKSTSITVAKRLGQFLGAEIIGVSSFHCIASICKESNKDIIVAFNIRNNNYAYAIFDKKNQMLLDYRLVVNREEFDQINKKKFKLLTDSSADSYLIDSSFDVIEINAEMISKLNISDIKDFIQKEVPLKPINDYSYVVNK